ncbi:MAG: hypothetical protein JJE13_12520 [Thermoleophilia bacterium]|nr:hypothetical protein [Thermoleophilia bacterium]
MDFKKLGQQVGQLKKQAEDKLGDRAEPDNLKRDGKELRNIMSGDGSLAEKAKEAKEKLVDRDPGKQSDTATSAESTEPKARAEAAAAAKKPADPPPSKPSSSDTAQ